MNRDLYDYIIDNNLDTSDVTALHATLAAETVSTAQPIRVAALAQYADPTITPKLLAAKANPQTPVQLCVAIEWALRLLSAKYDDFSGENVAFQNGLGALQAGGVLTADEADGIRAMGVDVQPRWPGLTEQDVRAALLTPSITAVAQQRARVQVVLSDVTASLTAILETLAAQTASLEQGQSVPVWSDNELTAQVNEALTHG